MVKYRDPGPIEFDAVIIRNTEVANSTAFVPFPFDVPELFGVNGRVPVTATFDGEPYSGSLIKMGGEHLLGMLRDIREKIGKEPGDTVHVTIALDQSIRTVELAPDVQTALEASGQATAFAAMSYSHQREYQQWIDGAKRAETRESRIRKMAGMLATGEKLK